MSNLLNMHSGGNKTPPGKPVKYTITLKQQFNRPIVMVDVATGKVLVNDIRYFWERLMVQSLEPHQSS